jgi:rubrerythrin
MKRISTIELAIENEKREMDFYLNEAKHSLNPMAKYMFETLAADEQDHINLLRKLHSELVKKDAWPTQVSVKIGKTNILKSLEILVKRHGSTHEHVDTDIDALKKSISFEDKAADFYAKIARETQVPEEAEFFNYLSKAERDHMSAIRDTLLYVENPSKWKAVHEGQTTKNDPA